MRSISDCLPSQPVTRGSTMTCFSYLEMSEGLVMLYCSCQCSLLHSLQVCMSIWSSLIFSKVSLISTPIQKINWKGLRRRLKRGHVLWVKIWTEFNMSNSGYKCFACIPAAGGQKRLEKCLMKIKTFKRIILYMKLTSNKSMRVAAWLMLFWMTKSTNFIITSTTNKKLFSVKIH